MEIFRVVVTLLCLAYMLNLLVMLVFRARPNWAYFVPGYPILLALGYVLLWLVAAVIGVVIGLVFGVTMFVKCIICLPELWKMEVPPRIPEARSTPSSGKPVIRCRERRVSCPR